MLSCLRLDFGRVKEWPDSVRLSPRQAAIAKTAAQIAVRILYLFAFLFLAHASLPAAIVPMIALGASGLVGFFYLNEAHPLPLSARLPPLLPMQRKEELPLSCLRVPCERPRGIYQTGANSCFSALIHYILSDPLLAKRLRRGFLPTEMLPFSQFLAAYDRAVAENRAVVDADPQAIRSALRQIDPAISSLESKEPDAALLLERLIEAAPEVHQIKYEVAIRYMARASHTIAGSPDGWVRTKEKKAAIELEPAEPPDLGVSLQRFFLRNQGLKAAALLTAEGKKRKFQAVRREIRFEEPPAALRIQIRRSCKAAFSRLPFAKPAADAPVRFPIQIPERVRIPLKNGARKIYRLSGCIIDEGRGLYKAGRIVNGQRYLVEGDRVTPIDRQIWEEKVAPYASLLCYLPADALAGR